jgi:hypothetical protein
VLRRRIEALAGTSRITISDSVSNETCRPTPHMLLYHINLGWPLLDEGAVFTAPIEETVWSSVSPEDQAYGCLTQPAPLERSGQQVFVHRVRPDGDGLISAALLNARLKTGLRVSWPKAQLPWLQQWQCATEGVYALGIEPVTNRFGSRADLSQSGEILELGAGEARCYDLAIDVLHGDDAAGALAAALKTVDSKREIPIRTGRAVP